MVGILLLVVFVITWIAWEIQVGGAGALSGGRAAPVGACPNWILSPGEVSGLLSVKDVQSVSNPRRQAQPVSSAVDSMVGRAYAIRAEGEFTRTWTVPPSGSAKCETVSWQIQAGPTGQSSRRFSAWSLWCRKKETGWVPRTGLGNIPPNLYGPALN